MAYMGVGDNQTCRPLGSENDFILCKVALLNIFYFMKKIDLLVKILTLFSKPHIMVHVYIIKRLELAQKSPAMS